MLTRLVIVGLLAAVSLGRAAPAGALESPVCTRGNTTVEVDPRGLLPLAGADPITPAARAALRFMKASDRPQVTTARLAIYDESRGPQAKFSCGARVWRRTVVVYITARAYLPAASASQRVFFVGRFRDGYRVWQVVH